VTTARLLIGTSGWSYADWVGPFFSAGTVPRDSLACYGREFGAVEIDSTFYRIPTVRMVERWRAVSASEFRFAPKAPRVITHEKRLRECSDELDGFFGVTRPLGPKLGPILFPFDAAVRADALPALAALLAGLPPDLRCAVEIRHRGWLSEPFYQLLATHRIALVLPDLYYMPKLDRITTDFTYIRRLGKRSAVPDDFSHVRIDRGRELDPWAGRIRGYLAQGVTVFVFVNDHYQGRGPATARALLSRLATSVAVP
jgi:uncharacterized protein YecE (DUF72 family)